MVFSLGVRFNPAAGFTPTMTPTPLQEIFKPTLQYLKAEQFDAARTNTNYISRVINIKKKIDSFIVQANDVIDDADTVRRKVFFSFRFRDE